MSNLTKKQKAVLSVLLSTVVTKGYQPSYREMAKALGYEHPSALMCHIKALARKGYISQNDIKSRALVLNWGAFGITKSQIRQSEAAARKLVRELP